MHRRDFLRMVSCMAGGAVLSTSTAHAGLKLANKTLEASMGRKRPNIIYIMADDLGYNHLGCYGQYGAQGKIRTPSIDKLASQGMRFSQAYAGGNVCGPSCSGQATIGQSKNNSNYKDCSLENEYAADFNGPKSSYI